MPVNDIDSKAVNAFTVEQLVLIRKLKESGISKELVAYAFESFDRVDQELGSLYNIPVALAVQAQALQRIALHRQTPGTVSTQADRSTASVSGGLLFSEAGAATAFGHNATRSNCMNGFADISLSAAVEPEIQEFVSFIGRGDAACCEEIRQFVVRHGIKQQQVALLSGICQSYISRFLKGDLYEMSERSRHAICKWYLKYRSNPTLIGPAANLASIVNNASNDTSQNQPNVLHRRHLDLASLDLNAIAANPSISDLLGSHRRERFVFRLCQIEILERYFQENSYPTSDIRAEIAIACNTALEESVGRKLTEREMVTVQIVSNWFANKRKDLKKAAREGGHDVSELLLRSRGRPPQLFYYSGNPNEERDSNGYDAANFASDESTSEIDQYGVPGQFELQNHNGNNEYITETVIKQEAASGNHHRAGEAKLSGTADAHDYDFVSNLSLGSSFEVNGIEQKSSYLGLPATDAPAAPDRAVASTNVHA